MVRVRHLLIAVLVSLALPLRGAAQTTPAPSSTPANQTSDLIRVFLDCDRCDGEYLRRTVGFLDYVRDRESADFQVLVTTQSTGSDGLHWVARFIGLGRFDGREHSLSFDTDSTASSDDQRKAFARIFKLGLATVAAGTSAGAALDVTWQAPSSTAPSSTPVDPWNFWVFSVNVNGNMNGEQSSSSQAYYLNLNANRTTDSLKVSFGTNSSVRDNSFDIDETETITTSTRSWGVNGFIARSLSPRWSLGGTGSVSSSSFSNIDRSTGAAPAIEFDVFPYSQSSQRSLTVQYAVGATHFSYTDLTIFDKLEETVPRQAVNGTLRLRQPWGSLSAYASVSQHLNNRSRYRATVWGEADVRLFKGFSFNVFAEYDKIKDQLSLRKADASQEEVLLRLRQLATGYSYYANFGISYRFGSIFNNVVNPRMNNTAF